MYLFEKFEIVFKKNANEQIFIRRILLKTSFRYVLQRTVNGINYKLW